jgi:hypothetical protein
MDTRLNIYRFGGSFVSLLAMPFFAAGEKILRLDKYLFCKDDCTSL